MVASRTGRSASRAQRVLRLWQVSIAEVLHKPLHRRSAAKLLRRAALPRAPLVNAHRRVGGAGLPPAAATIAAHGETKAQLLQMLLQRAEDDAAADDAAAPAAPTTPAAAALAQGRASRSRLIRGLVAESR